MRRRFRQLKKICLILFLCLAAVQMTILLAGCVSVRVKDEYDELGRLSAQNIKTGDTRSRIEYTYDEAGNLLLTHHFQYRKEGSVETVDPIEDVRYSYDEMGRCLSAVHLNGYGQVTRMCRLYYDNDDELADRAEFYNEEEVLTGWNEYEYTGGGSLAVMHQYLSENGDGYLWRNVYYLSDGQVRRTEEFNPDGSMR